MIFTILGSGSAGGVPAYGCDCSACRRAARRREYRRQSPCALIETNDTRLLIDAGLEDLGDRLPMGSFHAVLLTHYHVDHVQGLFRIRWGTGPRIPVIAPQDPLGCADLHKHPGILDFTRDAEPFVCSKLGDLSITPLPLIHSRPTFGYALAHGDRRIAYLTDTRGLPDDTAQWLVDNPPDVLVLDCSHPPDGVTARNHNDLDSALSSLDGITAGRVLLTHIDHRFDAWLMASERELPQSVEVAWDGQQIILRSTPPKDAGDG